MKGSFLEVFNFKNEKGTRSYLVVLNPNGEKPLGMFFSSAVTYIMLISFLPPVLGLINIHRVWRPVITFEQFLEFIHTNKTLKKFKNLEKILKGRKCFFRFVT